MSSRDWEARLCAFNLALLATHEVDSGFWKEWELFRLPGGLPGFLLANLLLFLVVLDAFRRVLAGDRRRRAASALVASTGVAAGILHGAFLAAGYPQFRGPVSLGVLGLWLATSIGQWALVLRPSRAAGGPATSDAAPTARSAP